MASLSEVILYSLNWTIFFELNFYTDEIGRRAKRIIHIAASIWENTINKHDEEESTISY